MRYVIFGGIDTFDNQPMFWNYHDGWGTLNNATIYLGNPADCNLPKYNDIVEPVAVILP